MAADRRTLLSAVFYFPAPLAKYVGADRLTEAEKLTCVA